MDEVQHLDHRGWPAVQPIDHPGLEPKTELERRIDNATIYAHELHHEQITIRGPQWDPKGWVFQPSVARS